MRYKPTYRVNRASRNDDGTFTIIVEKRRKWERTGVSGWTNRKNKYVLGSTGGENYAEGN